MTDELIRKRLAFWFTLHFCADTAIALPLMILPIPFLTLLGWETPDPAASRLVAAALLGIGIESLLGRKADLETFRAMLNLKLIWSLGAVTGLGITLLEGWRDFGGIRPSLAVITAVFAAFHLLWLFWRIQVGKSSHRSVM